MNDKQPNVTGFTIERCAGSSPWWVWYELDAWPHRTTFRGFRTKRSAAAAVRILTARSANAADAEIIVRDDATSFRRHGFSEAEALKHAGQSFVQTFGINAGLPFPDSAAFFAKLFPGQSAVL